MVVAVLAIAVVALAKTAVPRAAGVPRLAAVVQAGDVHVLPPVVPLEAPSVLCSGSSLQT